MGKGDREHAVSRGGHGSPEVTSEQNPEGEGASPMDFGGKEYGTWNNSKGRSPARKNVRAGSPPTARSI